MVSHDDPHDLPPGAAALQINVTCLRPSELTPRRGLQDVAFDTEE